MNFIWLGAGIVGGIIICLLIGRFRTRKYERILSAAAESQARLTEDNKTLAGVIDDLDASIHFLESSLAESNNLYTKLLSQKKSSEVRTGHIVEQVAPFLNDYPYDPKCTKFLGQPIDLICFDDAGIHFIEVKSGKSRLSAVQRRIKKQIEKKEITFEIFRVSGE